VPNLAANQREEGWVLAIALAKKRSTTGGTQRNKLVKGLKGFAIVNFTITLELDKNSGVIVVLDVLLLSNIFDYRDTLFQADL
jgi:hypothetical protein